MLFCCETKSQTNLVYNGDFEIYDTCPISISTPGDYQINHCLGWYCPTIATSDYFNTCANWPVSVPNNTFGYRYPFSGNGYCGILLERSIPPLGTSGWWIEYLQSKLNSSLIAGTQYEFSCKISFSNLLHEFAYWKFGAAFTINPINRNDAKSFSNIIPQIINQTNNYLSDTLNWIEINGRFTAVGNESYITIGFFTDTLNVDTLRFSNDIIDLRNIASYYYIDDVRLLKSECQINIPNVFSPNADSVNDKLIFTTCNKILKTTLYNRWGLKVFETTDVNHYWDGRTTSGEECIDGSYFYIIETEERNYKGFVQLVR